MIAPKMNFPENTAILLTKSVKYDKIQTESIMNL